jgi:hypothetical protein
MNIKVISAIFTKLSSICLSTHLSPYFIIVLTFCISWNMHSYTTSLNSAIYLSLRMKTSRYFKYTSFFGLCRFLAYLNWCSCSTGFLIRMVLHIKFIHNKLGNVGNRPTSGAFNHFCLIIYIGIKENCAEHKKCNSKSLVSTISV